jgi:hypothetical protein
MLSAVAARIRMDLGDDPNTAAAMVTLIKANIASI